MHRSLFDSTLLLLSATHPHFTAAAVPVQLVITGAETDLEGGSVTIVGKNFGEDALTITLGEVPLVVLSFSPEMAVAELPGDIQAGSFLLTVSAGPAATQTADFELAIGPSGLSGPVSPSLTVSVLCPGQTIAETLGTQAVELLVEFSGTCAEDVVVERDRTTIRGVPSGTIDGSLTVRGATNVTLEDFSVINGRGLHIIMGASAEVARVSAENTVSIGFRVSFSSNALLRDVTAINNSFAGIAATNSSHVILLGSVEASQSSNVGLFVGGSSELDSRATSLTVSDNAFAGVAAQSGGSVFLSTLSSSNNVVGVSLVNGGVAQINGGTITGSTYGVAIDAGSTAEIKNMTVDGGGVSVTGNSMLRDDNMTVTGTPNPDFGFGMVIRSSHLLTLGGSIDNSLFLAENGDANFHSPPVLTGGLICHPSAIAYGALSCPP